MRAPEFEASLAEAKLYPQLWRLLLGVGLVLLLWAGTAALILSGAVALVATQLGPMGILPWFTSLSAPDTPIKVLLLLSTFTGLFVGALVAAPALHGRSPATLFGSWPDWRRGFFTALGVLLPVYIGVIALSAFLQAPLPGLDLGTWLLFLPLTVAFIFLQTGAEELFFRGYLQQQLAARFAARWIWMWIPSAVFALLHWSPDAGGNLPLVLMSALVFGLAAADLTERTGSLGAAMGLHLGNNFIAIAVVSLGDTISGLSLFINPGSLSDTGWQSVSIAGAILLLLVVWGITVRLLDD